MLASWLWQILQYFSWTVPIQLHLLGRKAVFHNWRLVFHIRNNSCHEQRAAHHTCAKDGVHCSPGLWLLPCHQDNFQPLRVVCSTKGVGDRPTTEPPARSLGRCSRRKRTGKAPFWKASWESCMEETGRSAEVLKAFGYNFIHLIDRNARSD